MKDRLGVKIKVGDRCVVVGPGKYLGKIAWVRQLEVIGRGILDDIVRVDDATRREGADWSWAARIRADEVVVLARENEEGLST